MMTFKEIVEAESLARHPLQLPGVFGDGLLLSQSLTYRSVRKNVLKRGYRFARHGVGEYRIHSLGELPAILKKRQIPYTENRKTFQSISNRVSEATAWSQIILPHGNYSFHESCHCISQDFLELPAGRVKTFDLEAQKYALLEFLLSEAMANAGEFMVNLEATSDLHSYAVELNAYQNWLTRVTPVMQFRTSGVDRGLIFKTAIYGYLFYNYGFIVLGKTQFEEAWPLIREGEARISPRTKSFLQALFRDMVLNVKFVTKTNPYFFSLLGVRAPYARLLDYDFVNAISKSQKLKNAVNKFVQAASIVEKSRS